MRLPDSFLDDLRNRLSLSAVVGRRVVWDMKKSNQAKGDWWAPCPFHQEKSPSFHVDDRKGFYYCFGCQAKGNVFGFVQETENVGFMEAVEILAAEAGMPMPARDPKAAEKSDRRTKLAEVVALAAKWFRLQLSTNAAAEAREYLDRRGLTQATQERFAIGFAPDTSDALLRALEGKGVPWDLIEGAGLALEDEGRGKRDRFINRIVFPITDGRGRTIAFGGRAMNPNAKAKYLNSPETELFDKGANLYNLPSARAAAGKGQPLVVAEGYMDVIALHQAGFEAAVAPLGTAVTERQLQMLWRVTPEPLVALDGDAAGQRAGLRVADLALPSIAAGQALRFAILPEGQDPDDLIRAKGPGAMQTVLDEARPMLSLLWARAVDGKTFDSPERRAALDQELRALVRAVADPTLRRHYGDEVARLRADLFGLATPVPQAAAPQQDRPWTPAPRKPGPWKPGAWKAPPSQATTSARVSAAGSGSARPETMLEEVALAGLIHHPRLLEDFADALEQDHWATPEHGEIAAALLSVDPDAEAGAVRATLSERLPSLDRLLAQAHVRISPAARGDREAAAHCIHDALSRLAATRGADREAREALEEFAEGGDESMTWRLAQATRRRHEAQKTPRETEGNDDETSGMSDYLQGLLDTEAWKKTRPR